MRKISFIMAVLIVCFVYFAGLAATEKEIAKPPIAPIRPVTDDYFGQKIVDPYRWMEDMKSAETIAWLKAQAQYAESCLSRLPLREKLLQRLNQVRGAQAEIRSIRPFGSRFFYTRRLPGENEFRLCVRDGLQGSERILVDPEKLSQAGHRYSLGDWAISFDGRTLSYTIAAGGGEIGELRLFDLTSGQDLPDRFEQTPSASCGFWLPDGRSFLYHRLQKLPADAPLTEYYQKVRVYRHILGTSPDNDQAVFGCDVDPDISYSPLLVPVIKTDPSWPFVMAIPYKGVSPEGELYIAALTDLDKPRIPWRKISTFSDHIQAVNIYTKKVIGVGCRGDALYLITSQNAPRFKVIRTSLNHPDLSKAETIYSGGQAVVESIAAQADALYVQTLDGGSHKLWRVDYTTHKAGPVPLPYFGSAWLAQNEPGKAGIYFNLVSWTRSQAHFRYDPLSGKSDPTGLIPANPILMTDFVFTNIKVKSHDGVLIPMAIIHHKNLRFDGRNPVQLEGYGAYGAVWVEPWYLVDYLPWLERGGVLAWAGVRGGGEFGEEWHQAGFQQTKPNTWKDFIACAEYLVAKKYTSPSHLGIRGASAGGILISNCLAERPELFGAVVDEVGCNNMLRDETTANGVLNISEFGSCQTEAGFHALLAMDGYHKIKDRVQYPAVLLTHGLNDPRVEPWHSGKLAARLQAASSSGKPILLRLDYDTGHGYGSSKQQENELLADIYAFLFSQLSPAGK